MIVRCDYDEPGGFSVEQLMGVRRDGDVTSHGEYIGCTQVIGWPQRSEESGD